MEGINFEGNLITSEQFGEKLEKQIQFFSEENLQSKLLDSTPNFLIVFNDKKQIVFSNKAFKSFAKQYLENGILGSRLGEAINCVYAFQDKDGCGKSEFCSTCGAIRALQTSLKGKEDIQECRITQKDSKDSLDLRVWSKPLIINGQQFSIFTFSDISNEKRRKALERIFFHDVLNTASAIRSSLNLMNDSAEENTEMLIQTSSKLIDRLLGEIIAQKDLSLAESNELEAKFEKCNSLSIISDIAIEFESSSIAEKKKIEVDSNSKSIFFTSDEILIERVLSNMVKNALEASNAGRSIQIGCHTEKNKVLFYVHNQKYMPPNIRYQIFQRSFSTKGSGRGLGTYSMKLISERYLNGKVFFRTSMEEGTTFFAEYPISE